MKRILPFVLIAIVLGAGLLTVRYLQRASSESPSRILPAAPLSPSTSSLSPDGASQKEPGATPPHSHGNPNAPVTLEEFGDFQCPPCGMLHPILKDMEAQFGPANVRVIFREFPLVPAHAHALAAARSAEAAALQGKFWEMHDMIYEHQKDWHEVFDVRPIFEGYAKQIGLDVEQFRRDITSEVVDRRIFLDGKRAHALGVTGTPTVFINGREIPFESLAADKLKVIINNELAAQSK